MAVTNWSPQTSETTVSLPSVYFTDANTGWTVYSTTILKTTNGGTNWFPQSTGATESLESIYFIDANTGWAVGGSTFIIDSYTILKTVNGGTNWTAQIRSAIGSPLHSVYFTDVNTGWAAGLNGTILKTTNGGTSWSQQTSGTTRILRCVYFTDSNTGWTVGDDGAILKTTTGGIVSVKEKQSESVPNEFSLLQNHPNPFNTSTIIRFNLPKSSYVTLKVYNLLGKEIVTLVSDERPAGPYKVKWDFQNLASGIYFYRLQAGDYIESKRLVLLK